MELILPEAPAQMAQFNQVYVYDFTIFLDVEHTEILDVLKKKCKKWSFQREKCPNTGTLHYQGRISLKEKKRPNQLTKHLGFVGNYSQTCNTNKDNDYYVTKEESRIEGPWTDKDVIQYIPRDVRKITELKPWQGALLDKVKIYDERKITVIYDPIGNIGKTLFTRYCMAHGFAQMLPMVNDFKDVMRMVMDMPKSTCYTIDMPRAIKKEKLFQLYSGIEMIKTGYAFDDRYHFKQEMFDPPNVVVFTNVVPEINMLSRDRWDLFMVRDEQLHEAVFAGKEIILRDDEEEF